MGELKKLKCPLCQWHEVVYVDGPFFCPSCGAGLWAPDPPPPKANIFFEKTHGGKPGLFLLGDGRWQFICECGIGEIWSSKVAAEYNRETHRKTHGLIDQWREAISHKAVNDAFNEVGEYAPKTPANTKQ
jgi:hypothetical protein